MRKGEVAMNSAKQPAGFKGFAPPYSDLNRLRPTIFENECSGK
jgi:hypothetical protein